MHSRFTRAVAVALFVTLAAGAVGVAVGAAAGGDAVGTALPAHGDPVGDTDIVEVQTVSQDGTPPGEVSVTYGYHVGREIAGLEVTLPPTVDVTETDGFDATGEARTYRWDERTAEPVIETRYAVNRSVESGPEAVDTGGWALLASPNERATRIGYTVRRGTDVTVERETTVDGQGVAGENMVYLGEFERVAAGDNSLVIAAAAEIDDRERTVEAVERGLVHSSDSFDAGIDEGVTVFVVPEPLRPGGLAIGSDVWVRDSVLPPELTLWHEFVHTQQRYEFAPETEWTIEGSADYYAAVLAFRQGEIEYREFRNRLARGENFEGVALAKPRTWAGTRADYRLGALVIAALDREIRATGDGTYEDVLRAKNAHDGPVTAAEFEAMASEAAGTDLSDFFAEYVRSPPPDIDVPLPTMYDADAEGVALDVSATTTPVEADDLARVTVTLSNEGSARSLAPTLSATASGNATAMIDSDNGTRAGEGLVFEHLGPGESVQTTVLVDHGGANATLDVAVEDVSGVVEETAIDVTVVEDADAGDTGGADGAESDRNATDVDDDPGENPASGDADDAAGPGFGIAATAVALVGTVLVWRRRPQRN